MKHLKSYCDKVGVRMPEIRKAAPGEIVGGVARAVKEDWAILTKDDPAAISDYLTAHEMAHLLCGDKGDSHAHQAEFQAKVWEIEKHIRDERRKEKRGKPLL